MAQLAPLSWMRIRSHSYIGEFLSLVGMIGKANPWLEESEACSKMVSCAFHGTGRMVRRRGKEF